jgi:hypothetical protein
MLITKSNILDIISKRLNCMYLSDIKTDKYRKSALSLVEGINVDSTVKEYALSYIGG